MSHYYGWLWSNLICMLLKWIRAGFSPRGLSSFFVFFYLSVVSWRWMKVHLVLFHCFSEPSLERHVCVLNHLIEFGKYIYFLDYSFTRLELHKQMWQFDQGQWNIVWKDHWINKVQFVRIDWRFDWYFNQKNSKAVERIPNNISHKEKKSHHIQECQLPIAVRGGAHRSAT